MAVRTSRRPDRGRSCARRSRANVGRIRGCLDCSLTASGGIECISVRSPCRACSARRCARSESISTMPDTPPATLSAIRGRVRVRPRSVRASGCSGRDPLSIVRGPPPHGCHPCNRDRDCLHIGKRLAGNRFASGAHGFVVDCATAGAFRGAVGDSVGRPRNPPRPRWRPAHIQLGATQ